MKWFLYKDLSVEAVIKENNEEESIDERDRYIGIDEENDNKIYVPFSLVHFSIYKSGKKFNTRPILIATEDLVIFHGALFIDLSCVEFSFSEVKESIDCCNILRYFADNIINDMDKIEEPKDVPFHTKH